jgi:hypothetical protein
MRPLQRERQRLVRRDAQQLALLLTMLVDDIDVAWPDLLCAPEDGPARDDPMRDHIGDVRTAALELRSAIARLIPDY